MCIVLEKVLSYSVRQTSVCNHMMCFEELRLSEAPKRRCQWTLKCVGAIVNVWSSIHRLVRVGQYKVIWTWYTVRTTLKSKLKRLLPCRLSLTCHVREVTAMPLVSDLLSERGYYHASCQWLSMWERLLPCLFSVICYMSVKLLPCLLSMTCQVRGVTAMPLASDFLCERGYCYVSCQWLAICQRGYCHASCQWLAMWERLLSCLLSVTC
jgi:hypothetical protein